MIRHLVTFTVGIAIGVAVMLALDRSAPDSGGATQATSSQQSEPNEPKAEAQSAVTETADEPVDRGPTASATETAVTGAVAAVDNPVRIPGVYRDLVGSIPPPTPSSAEIHQLFEKEPRDEAWAYAMETGINNHIETFGAGEGAVVEYVECRSRHCEIAGFIQKNHKGSFGMPLDDIRRSGWWQADGGAGTHNIIGDAGGLRRFIIIVSRYDRE